ncbi:DoxX family protein [Hymenobacter fodinae]|uniref:DoxX family protein n=1 Tax=Hymenobacter fodinae TaxID=2510796 RepID=A0A4Z0P1Z2_9BACT|nr:DoxX family protein [Hymenobacter fodinae]TGE03835.1 DoxX family protein [Hymenobacter fodinae]
MTVFLWSLQGLLAAVFLLAGTVKLTQPAATVRALAPAGFSLSFLRGLGAVELLGAVGVLVPQGTGVLPWLTPLAAGGMGVVLAAAIGVHARQRAFNRLPFLLFLLASALVVAYSRRHFLG